MMRKFMQNKRYKAIVLLLIASLLWSSGGILIKQVSWNPVAIAGSRSLISTILMWAYLRKPKLTMSKPQVFGAFTYAGTVIFFVTANKLTTAANAILLQYTAPIFVAILSIWILKEKINLIDVFAIVAVFGGMVLFFINDINTGGMAGNLIAVLSGFFFACMTIAMRYQKNGSPIETTFLGNIITFLIALPFLFQITLDIRSIIGIILLGVFQLTFPYILYSWAIKHVTALEAILITVLEPLLNPLWVFMFSGERPELYAILGGVLVLGSVFIRSILVTKYPTKVHETGNEG